jgi:hypothetical protein
MQHPRLPREAGVIIALFVLSLPVLLGLAMLALDAGRLYHGRQVVNKATRVAALVAMSSVSAKGWAALVTPGDARDELGYQTGSVTQINPPEPNNTNTEVLNQIGQAAASTLATYYPEDFQDRDQGNLTSQYLTFNTSNATDGWSQTVPIDVLNMQSSAVSIGIRYDVATLLLGRVAELAGNSSCRALEDGSVRCRVQSSPAEQAGYLKPANIFLLLDTSGSMASPAGPSQTKLDVLKSATAQFIDMFNPHRDRISVIDFGTTVKSETALATFNSPNGDHLAIKGQLQELQAGGQTNPCDALIEAIRLRQGAELSQDSAQAVVLFTDGSPNVMRVNWCADANPNECTEPSRLTEARNLADSPPDQILGWYNAVVKWGERELASCPGGVGSARDCDPVYGWPKLKNVRGEDIPLSDIEDHLRLNEEGEFVWLTGNGAQAQEIPITSPALPNGPYTLQFVSKTRAQENYLWHGPSYLWHASFRVDPGASIIDRIPRSMGEPVTCGPGSRPDFPGNSDPESPGRPREMYTHSRYFASRVLNSLWRLDGDQPFNPNDPGQRMEPEYRDLFHRFKTGLDRVDGHSNNNAPIQPPPYYTQRGQQQIMDNIRQSPGCLTSLNAQIPFTDAQIPRLPDARIWMGDEFISNNYRADEDPRSPESSIKTVGEIVKTAEMPYYCALRAADYLRSQGAVVFVVGLGPSATASYSDQCNDPLQNALDFESRKDRFLRRLALAPESLADPEIFMLGGSSAWATHHDFGFTQQPRKISKCTQHPLEDVSVNMGYGEDISNDSTPVSWDTSGHQFTPAHLGAYYGSNDPSQLNAVFANIAKQILIRLST